MSRFLVLNFQDFGLDHHIKDTIKSHTVFCVCCLSKDVPLRDLDKCKHANFLDNFIKPEMGKYKNAICEHCHAMLKKIEVFRKQVAHSFEILKQENFKISNASTVRKMTLETKKTVNIYLPPLRRQAMAETQQYVANMKLRDAEQPSTDKTTTDKPKQPTIDKPTTDKATTETEKTANVINKVEVPVEFNKEFETSEKDPLAINDGSESNVKILKMEGKVKIKLEPSDPLEYVPVSEKSKEVTIDDTVTEEVSPPKKRVLVVTLSKDQLNRERVQKAQSPEYLRHKYRCEHCLIGFVYPDNLHDHYARKHTAHIGSITCEVCTQVIYPPGGINAHMFRHYTRYECEECHKQFIVFNDALAHYRRVHETATGYKCLNCDFVTTNHSEFTLHKLKHERYTCTDCGLLFTSRTGFRRHMTVAHKKTIYKCRKCRTVYESESAYVSHMRGHGDQPSCQECKVTFKSWHSYSAHLELSAAHNQRHKYPCPECGMRFVAAVYLRIHTQQRHSGLKKHVCQHCKKAFTLALELKRHIRKVHNEKLSQLIVCDYCGRAYKSRAHLVKHISDAHANKKPKKAVKLKRK